MLRPWNWVAFAIIALAAGLRIRGMFFPFDQDELYTVVESTRLFNSPLKPGIAGRPLYYLIEHVLLWLGPATPISLRALPLLLGVAGVGVTIKLGTRLFGPIAGSTAGLLAAISPWHLYASTSARYYSLVYLLAAVFFLQLALAYENDRIVHFVGAAAAGILGTVTHPSFLFGAFGAVLAVSIVSADGRIQWRWPSRRAFLWLWIPWAAILITAYVALALTGQLGDLRNAATSSALSRLRLLPAIVQWMTPTVAVMGGLGALVLIGLGSRPSWRRFGLMTAAGAGGAGVLLLIADTRSVVYADYGIAALPLLFGSSGALVELGAQHLAAGRRLFAALCASIVSAGVLPSTISYLSDGTRFDYRPAFRAVAAEAPTIPVLTWPLALARYYAPTLDSRELTLDPQTLDAALGRARDLWVVLSYREYGLVGDDGQGAAWFAAHCRRVRTDRGLRFDSRLYEVALERCRVGS